MRSCRRDEALREIVNTLPRLQREITQIRLIDGGASLTARELAERLNSTTGSIRVQQSRALESIRNAMRARGLYREEGGS